MKNPYARAVTYDWDNLLKIAFRRAFAEVKKAELKGDVVERARQKEGIRIKISASTIHDLLKNSANSFPSYIKVPEIYKELITVVAGGERVSNSRHALLWTANKVKDLQMIYLDKLQKDRHTQDFRRTRREAYGRMTSFVKKIRKDMKLLEDAAKILKKLPDFENIPTIIIAGLPNVGKTSLLGKITKSKPKVQEYPFTTRGLMLGYKKYGFKKVQFIDTPGLLDRKISKRNRIEMQSIAVIDKLSHIIIYVFDPSETCGYTVSQQNRLYDDIKKVFDKPIIPVSNKSDTVGGKPLSTIQSHVDEDIIEISCEDGRGLDNLNKFIKECIKYL